MEIDTGETCATAQVACGVGNCAARIHNRCPRAVSCELTVQCVCRAFTGENGEAVSGARDTVPERASVGLRAHVLCGAGEVVATHAKKLSCH
jgi:hypothetical protein